MKVLFGGWMEEGKRGYCKEVKQVPRLRSYFMQCILNAVAALRLTGARSSLLEETSFIEYYTDKL